VRRSGGIGTLAVRPRGASGPATRDVGDRLPALEELRERFGRLGSRIETRRVDGRLEARVWTPSPWRPFGELEERSPDPQIASGQTSIWPDSDCPSGQVAGHPPAITLELDRVDRRSSGSPDRQVAAAGGPSR
jgi:hypothetical protein